MIVAAFLMAQAALPDTIVVMAERLRAIEVTVGQDQTGAWRCSLSASSGNARADDLLCRAATACSQAHGNDREALGECMAERRPGILEDFRRNLRREG